MNDIVISATKIEEWKLEKLELEAAIRIHQEKLELIEKRLQAVALFTENTNEVVPIRGQAESSIGDLSTAEAIIFTLRDSKTFLDPGQIRSILARKGYPQDRWGKNGVYFYSALKRLADGTKIAKRGKKYGALPDEQGQMRTNSLAHDMDLQ